jgi:hypothetical protein
VTTIQEISHVLYIRFAGDSRKRRKTVAYHLDLALQRGTFQLLGYGPTVRKALRKTT